MRTSNATRMASSQLQSCSQACPSHKSVSPASGPSGFGCAKRGGFRRRIEASFEARSKGFQTAVISRQLSHPPVLTFYKQPERAKSRGNADKTGVSSLSGCFGGGWELECARCPRRDCIYWLFCWASSHLPAVFRHSARPASAGTKTLTAIRKWPLLLIFLPADPGKSRTIPVGTLDHCPGPFTPGPRRPSSPRPCRQCAFGAPRRQIKLPNARPHARAGMKG